MAELSDSERLALAREVAADGYRGDELYQVQCPECSERFHVAISHVRRAFTAGWDAAMEYVNVQTKEQ